MGSSSESEALAATLTAEQSAFVRSCVESGDYGSSAEVLRAALESLKRDQRQVSHDVDDLRAAADEAPALIALVGPDMRYAFANKAYERFFGRPREAVVGAHVSAILGADAFAEIGPRLKQAFAGSTIRYDVLAPNRDGSYRWLEAKYIPRRNADGSVRAVLVLVSDVHDRREAEKRRIAAEKALTESTRLEALGRLTASIAHDFNNWLLVVRANVELLQATPGTAPDDETLRDIEGAVDRTAQLTKQLCSFGRKRKDQPPVLAPGTIVDATVPLLERVLGKGIELRVETHRAEGLVAIDAGELDQVVMNLVLNARDSISGGGSISVDVRDMHVDDAPETGVEHALPGDYVVVSVSDTGRGISPDDLPHIFEAFYTSRASEGGTGLGLASVQGIAKRAGGNVFVDSKVGEGTTFRVYLPVADASAAPAP